MGTDVMMGAECRDMGAPRRDSVGGIAIWAPNVVIWALISRYGHRYRDMGPKCCDMGTDIVIWAPNVVIWALIS